MTFIINILHSKYSLLLSDKRSVEINEGDHEPNDIINEENIDDNVNKIDLFANNRLAIAISGLIESHPYKYDIVRLVSEDESMLLNQSLNKLDEFTRRPYGCFDWYEHINSFLATYYCNINQSFQCIKFVFGSRESYHHYRKNNLPVMISAGCGSRTYKQIPNLENEINDFINSLNENLDLPKVYNFFQRIYLEVSRNDSYVSSNFDMFHATIGEKQFTKFEYRS